jgi:hypothetical protein
VLALPIVTIALSERGEVVRLRTYDGGTDPQDTRLWIVELDGASFVRGLASKGWVQRARANPRVRLRRAGEWRELTAVELDPASWRGRVNEAMRDKYGPADWLTAIFRDFDQAVPFRLDPVDGGGGPGR